MKIHYIYTLIFVLATLGCTGTGGNNDDENEDYTDSEPIAVFQPEGAMPLAQLCDIPGVGWALDTIYGVCVPDTLVLWATYDDKFLPTTIRGADCDFPGLTEHGVKTINADTTRLTFTKADFDERARLLSNLEYSRGRMKLDADSVLEKRVFEMVQTATDFFTSHGMTKYMAKPLAGIWEKVNRDAQAEGVEAPNPINGYNQIEFEPGSVTVIVDDAQKGIVRVKAYVLDDFTLRGRHGWGYWRMVMTKEGRQFKVKDPPLMIRPGEDFEESE